MKRAIIKARWELLRHFIRSENYINVKVIKGIPEDAKILGIRNDNMRYASDVIEILIESESLDELSDGEQLPEYDVVFENLETIYIKANG